MRRYSMFGAFVFRREQKGRFFQRRPFLLRRIELIKNGIPTGKNRSLFPINLSWRRADLWFRGHSAIPGRTDRVVSVRK